METKGIINCKPDLKDPFKDTYLEGLLKYHEKKHDLGKPRMDLLPFDALEEIAKVYTFGCTPKEKGGAGYAEDSWKTVPDGYKRYKAAQLRHEVEIDKGHPTDAESSLMHEAHIAWNAIARVWFKLQERKGVTDARQVQEGQLDVQVR